MIKQVTKVLVALVFSMAAFAVGAQQSPRSVAGPGPEAGPAHQNDPRSAAGPSASASSDTFDRETILEEAESYLGHGAEGLAVVIEKVFKEYGEPNGYIKGNEAGGALVFGLRYGNGRLIMKNGIEQVLHWQGPSLGFDIGGNAAKVFTLVYNLPNVDSIFQRFPGVDGSLYFVGGVGVNYLQSDEIVLAPIRLGVGWRQGINVGYLNIRRDKSWNPF